MKSIIGIDFDNTIICYDHVFNKIGIEKHLIPETLAMGKGHVRDYLRQQGKENEWIWLQGYVYGNKLDDAEMYEGVNAFLEFCSRVHLKCYIVSHKTKYPYSGDTYDLHKAASRWIEAQCFGVEYFFELTKADKIKRINDLGCTHFIDDLPEFLALDGFPTGMRKILFDPLKKYSGNLSECHCVNSWPAILDLFDHE